NSPSIDFTSSLTDFSFYNLEFTGPNVTNGIINNNTGRICTFNNVSFAGHGNINGKNSFGALTFSSGKNYILQSGIIQTLTGSLTAQGACGNNILIKSSTSGSQAYINKAGGSVDVDYVSLQDIWAQGTATFNATNSIAISNVNAQWNITAPAGTGANYYWIAGTGNWSDPLHWSLTSGGTPNGPGCIPGSSNNVYFDANSGFTSVNKTVTVNVSSASCKDMDWTGSASSPVFTTTSGSNTLSVYGSLTLISGMTWSFTGPVSFAATSTGKTITSANKQFQNTVSFDGNGGGWTLMDGFTNPSSLTSLNYGSLNTNGQTMNIYYFNTNNSNVRSLTLGSTLMQLSYCCGGAFSVNLTNLTLNAGTSTIRITTNSNSPSIDFTSSLTDFSFYNLEFTGPNVTNGIINNNTGHICTFNNVSFAGHGNINGNNKYNSLTLGAGRTYIFQSSTTQTFLGSLNATGTSGQMIDIHTSTSGVQTTFTKASGCVVLDYILLKDNKALGGANWYTGSHSTNVGNNNGWTIGDPTFLGTPGAISGNTSVCAGSSGNTYSISAVAGASGYTWSVPTGATITGGQNSTSITVNMGTALLGSISVVASNLCFTSASSSLALTINPLITPLVAVSPSSNPTCAGYSVLYTATPTNGGSTPVFQWKVNNINQGSNSSTFAYIPASNDQVSCILVSNATCPSPSTATSNTVTMTLNPIVTPAVTITASSNPSCIGSSVSYTAVPLNGGSNPVYQWKVNGSNQGTNSSTYSYIPANNNLVSCIMTSNATCISSSTATSNSITMTVNPLQTPAVSITTATNPSCAGNSVIYNASPVNGGAAPVYQWQVNGSNQGTNSATLNYIAVNNDQVRCIMASNAACASPVTATSNAITMTVNVCTQSWTGAADSNWNNIANWSGGQVPLPGTNVTISSGMPHQPEIYCAAKCNALTIANGATLTIRPNWSLTAYGTTTLNGSQCLIIKSTLAGTGSFIDNGTISGSGTMKMERYITANFWHYISPVIPTATAGVFNACYLKKWAEVNYSWTNITSTSTPLNVMVGYALKSNITSTYNYIGKPNTGAKTIAVTKNTSTMVDSKKGWNLVGNPYPSTVNWDTAGWTKTNVNDAIYIYNQTYANYASYVGGFGTNGGTKYIAPGQGFYVVCNNIAGGTLGMTGSVRLHKVTSFFKSAPTADYIRLTLNHKDIEDDIIIRIDPEATSDFDGNFDAYKIVVPEMSQLWSTTVSDREEYYSINTLPDVISNPDVPVSMVATEDGTYSIKATDFTSLSTQTGLFLEDLKTGAIVNLADAPVYTFSASVGDDANRFMLHFSPLNISSVETNDESGGTVIFPSPNKGSFTISCAKEIEGTSLIEIYNVLGEMIFTQKVNKLNNYEITFNEYSTGVYYAKIISPDRNRIIRFIMTK
ncbi:MAG: T9SS type A sorting domain-containing protein, partial [Bacteroidota bacterium]